MTGKDLFFALTELDDELILETPEARPRAHRPARLGLRIAVIAALVALLVVTAGAALLRGSLELSPIQIENGRDGYVVSFRATDDQPVEMESWYPDWLPEGMEMYWSTTNEWGYQTLQFRGQEEYFALSYGKMGQLPDKTLTSVRELEAITIGTCPGYWIVDMAPLLVWADQQRGIAFWLVAVNLSQDTMIAIAESVAPTDYIPGRYQYEADAARVKLGDYDLQHLPQGYGLYQIYGAPCNPISFPANYGYVHKVYRDVQYYELHLYYEHTSLFEPSRVELPHGSRLEIDLRGQTAWLICDDLGNPCAVSWEQTDPNGIRLLFTLKADHLTRKDLLEAAESLVCVTQADTTHFKR